LAIIQKHYGREAEHSKVEVNHKVATRELTLERQVKRDENNQEQ